MTLGLGIGLSAGMMLAAFVVLSAYRWGNSPPASLPDRLVLAGAYLVITMGALSIAVLVLDLQVGLKILQATIYSSIAYGVLAQLVPVRALYRHFRRPKTTSR